VNNSPSAAEVLTDQPQRQQEPILLPDLIEKPNELQGDRRSLIAFIAHALEEVHLRASLENLNVLDLEIMSGGINKAINYLRSNRSPLTLIVDLSGTDMPLSRVYDLADVCEPDVTLIAIGDKNDVGLYRSLKEAGIAEYIVKPVTTELLFHALSPNSTVGKTNVISQKLGKLIAVLGSRGGVGVTTIAINLAWYLAHQHRRRVALVDLDLQYGDCALALELKPTPGLREALLNPQRVDKLFLDRAMVQYTKLMSVLSFQQEPLAEEIRTTTDAIQTLLATLQANFHYVIVDVIRPRSGSYRVVLELASRQIIVADHTLHSVRDAARLHAALNEPDAPHRSIVLVNRSGEGGRKQLSIGGHGTSSWNTTERSHPFSTDLVRIIEFFIKTPGESLNEVRQCYGKASDRDFGYPCRQGSPLVEEAGYMRLDAFGRRIVENPASGKAVGVEPNDRRSSFWARASARPDPRELIRAALMTRIDPSVASRMPREILLNEITKLVNEIATEDRVHINQLEEADLATQLTDDMTGLGPLEHLLKDDEITDILVNGPFAVYIERGGRLEKTTVSFRDANHVFNVAQRIASSVGRRIDEANPMADARLSDGSRVHIVLPPLVLNGGCISIRKFSHETITLDAMIEQTNLSQAAAKFLEIAAKIRLNLIISGGTGSGKTTLLNAISEAISPSERIITIEDAVELRLQQPHVVQMETRTPNVEGVGFVGQRELVRNALRMRPDRIIVGEVRGSEAFDMLQAMNTGHDGSMSTIHANSCRDALTRLENMVVMANVNWPPQAIRAQIASALSVIVHIERMRDGLRRIQNIVEIVGIEGEIIITRDLFTFKYKGERSDGYLEGILEPSQMRPNVLKRAARYGLERQLLATLGLSGG
jgi:pilus assembly protein CpaF